MHHFLNFFGTHVFPLFDTLTFKFFIAIFFIAFFCILFHNDSFSRTETKKRELEKFLNKRQTKQEKNKEIN